ncbi:MAG: hypothetical protein V3T39_01775 [Gammaproteobacteria bacterium]
MTIYLDNNSTTLTDERVLTAMMPFLAEQYVMQDVDALLTALQELNTGLPAAAVTGWD